MRIGVIMRRPRAAHATPMTDAIAQLAADGASVELLHPSESPIDLSRVRVAHDLYVLKEKTDLTLSFAAALHTAGATILNSFPVSLRLRDKVLTCKVLQAAGVPTPATYVASHLRDGMVAGEGDHERHRARATYSPQLLHRFALDMAVGVTTGDVLQHAERHVLRRRLGDRLDRAAAHVRVAMGAGDVDDRAQSRILQLAQALDRLTLYVLVLIGSRDRNHRRQHARVALVVQALDRLAPHVAIDVRPGEREQRIGRRWKWIDPQRLDRLLAHA